MSGSFLFVLLGGIIGTQLAPAPALATLPVSVLVAGVAASVLPAGALIHRFGRRAVFVGSALQAAAGCILAGYAIAHEPAALGWHVHRRDEESLRRQVFGYGSGLSAYAFTFG